MLKMKLQLFAKKKEDDEEDIIEDEEIKEDDDKKEKDKKPTGIEGKLDKLIEMLTPKEIKGNVDIPVPKPPITNEELKKKDEEEYTPKETTSFLEVLKKLW